MSISCNKQARLLGCHCHYSWGTDFFTNSYYHLLHHEIGKSQESLAHKIFISSNSLPSRKKKEDFNQETYDTRNVQSNSHFGNMNMMGVKDCLISVSLIWTNEETGELMVQHLRVYSSSAFFTHIGGNINPLFLFLLSKIISQDWHSLTLSTLKLTK